MNPTALATDFHRLPLEVQRAHQELLEFLEERHMSCRCEIVGRDFIVIVGRGLSSAKYWLDMYSKKPLGVP